MENFKRQDFIELKNLLLEYFQTEDNLSSAFIANKLAFDIEETVIKLAEEYKK